MSVFAALACARFYLAHELKLAGFLFLLRFRLLFLFLVPCFSAVLDLGQECSDSLNFCFSPHMDNPAAYLHDVWSWYFLFGDVAAQGFDPDPQFPGRLTRRKSDHSDISCQIYRERSSTIDHWKIKYWSVQCQPPALDRMTTVK